MSNNNGGQAFPMAACFDERTGTTQNASDGMSMRQYYKAAALRGYTSNADAMVAFGDAATSLDKRAKNVIAAACGIIADAMLAEDRVFAEKNR